MMDLVAAQETIIAAGRRLHENGWVPATSGNLSCRLNDGRIAITVSGHCKGELDSSAIMCVDSDGRPLDNRRPSAETGLHVQIYALRPEARVVLHTHSLTVTVLSDYLDDDWWLAGLELLKAFPDVTTHETELRVAVYDNDQDIDRLAAKIGQDLAGMDVPGYLLRGHGLYAWGQDMRAALRHLEAFEHLARYTLACKGKDRP